MKLKFLFFLFLIPHLFYGQDFSNDWTGHFSYLDVSDISYGETKIFGAAENAIFVYDRNTNEVEKISTIQGLSGETISSIEYIESRGLLFIGFENGLVQIYIESSQEVRTVVDILDKPSIPPTDKRINDFYAIDNSVYISTNYGISIYNSDAFEFGDTYFIGQNGTLTEVSEMVIFNDFIYAATATGLRKAAIDNPNLIDYQQWQLATTISLSGIETTGDKLYGISPNRRIYDLSNNSPVSLFIYPTPPLDIRYSNENLVVTIAKNIYVYTGDFIENFSASAIDYDNINFTSGFSDFEDDKIYVGTSRVETTGVSGLGVIEIDINDTTIFQEIHPQSPLRNNFFQVRTQANEIWATHGGHGLTFNPYQGIRRTGLSHFIDEEWNNISYDSLTSIMPSPWALSYISINPFNTGEVYISSSIKGLIYIKDNVPETWYNEDNSTITPFFTTNYFVFASNFDEEGALWVLNGRNINEINRFKDGQWTDYSLEGLINPSTSNLGFSSIVFDKDKNIFMGSHNYGLIGYNPMTGTIKNISETEENMPSPGVKTIAIDKQNQLWLGTGKGLRIVFNTSEFMEGEPEVSNIVVLDNGVPSELLFQQFVTDIEVDGSNNKWVATLDTGVYYFSSDGQETIYHFTKDNSPLPTNDILDIAIDDISGQIYFATEKGMVAFNSESSVPVNDIEEAYVYPNPVRPNFNINEEKIKIKGITGNVNIKITDIEGNLVTEAETRTNTKFKGYNLEIDGGTALWNGKNMSNQTVATGVYLVLISDLDSFETRSLKLMIVR